jgi:hypothetical protein
MDTALSPILAFLSRRRDCRLLDDATYDYGEILILQL